MSQIKVELQEFMGSDRSIAEAAWTSSSDNQNKKLKTDEQVKDLVKRLIKDKHATPVESVVFRFWIKMPIQTDRQHVTHRIATHNGMSGRYRTMPNEWLKVPEDILDIHYKANTSESGIYMGDTRMNEYEDLCKEANDWYQSYLEFLKDTEKQGRISNSEYKRMREFFRGVLPQNNMTERVTVMNLRSFANYQKLRNSPHAQPEIQEVAKQMLEAVEASGICPIAIQALKDNGWNI